VAPTTFDPVPVDPATFDPAPLDPTPFETGSPEDQCPACGSVERRTLFSATDRLYRTTTKVFQIVECLKCRLIRLHPQPSPIELRDYYPERYWYVAEDTTAARLEQWYRRLVLRDHLHFVERALRESE